MHKGGDFQTLREFMIRCGQITRNMFTDYRYTTRLHNIGYNLEDYNLFGELTEIHTTT